MQRAIGAQQAGRLDIAVRDYRMLLQRYPNIFEIRSNLGAALAGEGKYTEAIAEYKHALALEPNPQVRLNLALAYYKTGDLGSAIDALKRVHAEDPNNTQTIALLSDCYLKRGQNEDVISLLTPIQQAHPDNEAFVYLLGTALVRDGQVARGQALIDTILKNGDSAESRLLMGTARYMAGDYRGAREDFQKAVELNPNLPEAFAYYGMALLSIGERAGARDAFEHELELDPNNFIANLQMGLLLGESHNYVGAMEYLRHALAVRPHDPGTRFEAASIELARGRLAEATRDLESLLKDSPDFIEAHWALATAYLRENRKADGARERVIAGRLNGARAKEEVAATSSP